MAFGKQVGDRHSSIELSLLASGKKLKKASTERQPFVCLFFCYSTIIP
jgi:hypothetical protein